MDSFMKPSSALFEVYLRLRPAAASAGDRFLDIEEPEQEESFPNHITIKPPENDRRKRAVERFAFTRVFEENDGQLDIFKGTQVLPLIEGVLGDEGKEGRDGLLATLGMTGSGKSHTILGSKSQRGLTQMALDVLFQNIGDLIVDPTDSSSAFPSIAAADVSEAKMFPAHLYLDSVHGDGAQANSRAQTPVLVCNPNSPTHHPSSSGLYPSLPHCPNDFQENKENQPMSFSAEHAPVSPSKFLWAIRPVTSGIARITKSAAAKIRSPVVKDGTSFLSTKSRHLPRVSTMPSQPAVDDLAVNVDETSEYAIVISMFEVYNDRIYDLLTGASQTSKSNTNRRRALLFKPTEQSPDRKQVAGLKKIICGNIDEALMVLETGLMERKVTGTGSNAVSSRSHGFFCVEVKKRHRATKGPWASSTLTICDLAGSERARNAKTAGETLAEAGKINESLMYLGQCMQMQADNAEGNKQNVVPFRQCKLTELLFSNSFPSHSSHHSHSHHQHHPRRPQKAIMIVTADPHGDFNATSQILRYSALAREVTVPRIPSATSAIQVGNTIVHARPGTSASNHHGAAPITIRSDTPAPEATSEELNAALQEINRLHESVDVLQLQLREERSRRRAAEQSWRAAEDYLVDMEQQLRDELADEYETRLAALQRQYRGAWDEEQDRNDERLDRKIDLLTKSTTIAAAATTIREDADDGATQEELARERQRAADLQDENDELRQKVALLERAAQQAVSPTKSQTLPVRKTRVLKAKKWRMEDDPFDSS
ncbi:P-loop containing nucleoside triphosphate hydrolase protein [Phyllosticta capitalensis]|uniref:Kinesin-like protein n=1 Tax=Phyllosticta capitalensis TaxID=121624 RepID=A0ABR1YUW4_9PEZI